jgi:hypothetical protein
LHFRLALSQNNDETKMHLNTTLSYLLIYFDVLRVIPQINSRTSRGPNRRDIDHLYESQRIHFSQVIIRQRLIKIGLL